MSVFALCRFGGFIVLRWRSFYVQCMASNVYNRCSPQPPQTLHSLYRKERHNSGICRVASRGRAGITTPIFFASERSEEQLARVVSAGSFAYMDPTGLPNYNGGSFVYGVRHRFDGEFHIRVQ